MNKTFKAYRTEESAEGFINSIQQLDFASLPSNEVTIKVAYSGINYKDYLSSIGNRGVTKRFPHTPGVDASGWIEEDTTHTYTQGQPVIVMGFDMGMNQDGAFAEYIRVPAAHVLPLPSAFSLEEAMRIGTSGFTAALGIRKMIQMGAKPSDGPLVVSGATGGVGSFAVIILAGLGFEVWAMTGKAEKEAQLRKFGAQKILRREDVMLAPKKALARPRWAGAFDCVGGQTLTSLLRQCQQAGSVATCGNVGGAELEMTVYPFILNGVNLLGINAADTPMTIRKEIWKMLEKAIDPTLLLDTGTLISLEEVTTALDKIGKGKHTGRYTLKL